MKFAAKRLVDVNYIVCVSFRPLFGHRREYVFPNGYSGLERNEDFLKAVNSSQQAPYSNKLCAPSYLW